MTGQTTADTEEGVEEITDGELDIGMEFQLPDSHHRDDSGEWVEVTDYTNPNEYTGGVWAYADPETGEHQGLYHETLDTKVKVRHSEPTLIERGVEETTLRRRNTNVNYDLHLSIPRDLLADMEDGHPDNNTEDFVKAIAKRHFNQHFDITGRPNVGIVNRTEYPDEITFNLMVMC